MKHRQPGASRRTERDAVQLVVYVAEPHVGDRRSRVGELIRLADQHGLAGATVLAAFQGYGRHHEHRSTIRQHADETPLSVVFVDLRDQIESFLPTITRVLPEAVMTMAEVRAIAYRPVARTDTPP